MIPEQKLLTLHWRSFSGDRSDVDASIFGFKGCQYFDYVSQRPCPLLIIRLTRPKIIDAALTRISRMGQRLCHYPLYPEKPPLQSLWKDVTMQRFVYPNSKTKNCWCSVDAKLNNILNVCGCSTIVFKNAYSRYCQPINCFHVSTFASKSFQASQFLIHH